MSKSAKTLLDKERIDKQRRKPLCGSNNSSYNEVITIPVFAKPI